MIDRVRDNFINGRFIEKISYEETVLSPFGDEQRFDRTVYNQTEFNLFSKYPNIELWNPPRSTQGYVSKLIELNNFEVSLQPISVDLLVWMSSIQRALSSELIVDSIQLSGLEFDAGIAGRVSLSGEKDVRKALLHLTRGKSFDLERVQFKFPSMGKESRILLSNSGAVRLDENITEDLLPVIREALPLPIA